MYFRSSPARSAQYIGIAGNLLFNLRKRTPREHTYVEGFPWSLEIRRYPGPPTPGTLSELVEREHFPSRRAAEHYADAYLGNGTA